MKHLSRLIKCQHSLLASKVVMANIISQCYHRPALSITMSSLITKSALSKCLL